MLVTTEDVRVKELEAEVERLREALRGIVVELGERPDGDAVAGDWALKVATNALLTGGVC